MLSEGIKVETKNGERRSIWEEVNLSRSVMTAGLGDDPWKLWQPKERQQTQGGECRGLEGETEESFESDGETVSFRPKTWVS